MRQMKDTGIEWIGKIPETWKTLAIKHLMQLYAGATPKSDNSELWDGDIPWITPADYKTEDVYVSGGRRNISEKGLQSCATTVLPINSIIFSKRAPIGLVALNNTPLCTNQGCIGCIVNQQKANNKFYYYVLSVFTEQFELFGSGTTFKEISANNFANFKVILPPISEQKLIADYLDTKCGEIDSLIALQEQMIEKLKAYKQSVITEAVTKGLDPNAKLVPSGIDWIGEIPEGWKVLKTKFIADKIFKGNGITKEEVFPDGDTPCVRYGEIYSKYTQSFTNCISSTKLDIQKSPQYFQHGDILCAGTGELVEEIGKSIVYLGDQECLAGGDIIVIHHHQNPSFLNYALNSNYAQTQKSRGKAKLKVVHISAFEIGITYILLPPLSEQHSIASYLDDKCSDIDHLIALKQQKIASLKDYKKSVIYEAVTGKTEI